MVFPESVFDEVTRPYWPADHPEWGHALFQMQVFAVNNKGSSQGILIDGIEQRQHLSPNKRIIPIDQHNYLMILAIRMNSVVDVMKGIPTILVARYFEFVEYRRILLWREAEWVDDVVNLMCDVSFWVIIDIVYSKSCVVLSQDRNQVSL